MNRRHAIALSVALPTALREMTSHAKPACRPDGHPSEGNGNTCCSGFDDGHTCIADPNGGGGGGGTGTGGGTTGGTGTGATPSVGGVTCKTGESPLKCCRRAVKAACRGEGGDCRKRGKRRCKRKFSTKA